MSCTIRTPLCFSFIVEKGFFETPFSFFIVISKVISMNFVTLTKVSMSFCIRGFKTTAFVLCPAVLRVRKARAHPPRARASHGNWVGKADDEFSVFGIQPLFKKGDEWVVKLVRCLSAFLSYLY